MDISKEKRGIYYHIKNKQGVSRLLVHENYVRPSLNKEISDCKSLNIEPGGYLAIRALLYMGFKVSF